MPLHPRSQLTTRMPPLCTEPEPDPREAGPSLPVQMQLPVDATSYRIEDYTYDLDLWSYILTIRGFVVAVGAGIWETFL